jgi:mRNA interferase MazF
MAQRIFNRGEIYWANLDEEESEKELKDKKPKPKGAETQKNRPGVIISNQKQNQFSQAVIVALITSQVDKIYPFEVEIVCEGQASKILTDQIYTIDKSRLERKMGELTEKQLIALAKGLHIVLELKNCSN